jgi:serine/threonine-protein kinase
MSLNIGDTIGDYQIIGVLGAGGMGKVYRVRNVISDRVEAMKVLLPNLAEEAELADRFIREIKLVASLDHPNIAGLHTALRIQNQLLMFMEYVEGTTLEERLKQGPLPVEQAAGCVDQVLAALEYAHQRGVIHRDIKPANMMLTPAGKVKLMDFGIAKAAADRRLTMTGTTLGSLYYMSPEQIQGSASLDGRADLYSVGVSLYELVTGQRPFKGDSDYSIMAAHLEQSPVPPIQLDPSLPQVLSDLILTAIQKDPARRFQSAQAFRGALRSLKGTAPAPWPVVQAPVPQPAPQPVAVPAPPAKTPSRRGLYMALGAVVAIVVIVLAATQIPRWQKTQAGESTTAPAAQETPAQVQPPSQPTTPAEQRPPAQPAAQPPAAAKTKPSAVSSAKSPATTPTETPQAAAPAAAPQAAPAARPEARPEPSAAEIQQLRERMITLASRANALRASIQNLEAQQRRAGLSLRTDMATSWRRMEAFLDEAEAAMKGRDWLAFRRSLDLAEREADRLDEFLGR